MTSFFTAAFACALAPSGHPRLIQSASLVDVVDVQNGPNGDICPIDPSIGLKSGPSPLRARMRFESRELPGITFLSGWAVSGSTTPGMSPSMNSLWVIVFQKSLWGCSWMGMGNGRAHEVVEEGPDVGVGVDRSQVRERRPRRPRGEPRFLLWTS